MRISVDVDGVLAAFTCGFACAINRLWPGKLPPDYVPTEWSYSSVLAEAEVDQAWEEVKRTPNFFEHLPPYPESIAAMHSFFLKRPSSLDIYYITSRIQTAGDSVMQQTQRFLARHRLLRDGCSVVIKPRGVTKLEIYDTLHIHSSIDDYDKNVPVGYAQHALLERPWNWEHRKGRTCFSSLEDYLRFVLQRNSQ